MAVQPPLAAVPRRRAVMRTKAPALGHYEEARNGVQYGTSLSAAAAVHLPRPAPPPPVHPSACRRPCPPPHPTPCYAPSAACTRRRPARHTQAKPKRRPPMLLPQHGSARPVLSRTHQLGRGLQAVEGRVLARSVRLGQRRGVERRQRQPPRRAVRAVDGCGHRLTQVRHGAAAQLRRQVVAVRVLRRNTARVKGGGEAKGTAGVRERGTGHGQVSQRWALRTSAAVGGRGMAGCGRWVMRPVTARQGNGGTGGECCKGSWRDMQAAGPQALVHSAPAPLLPARPPSPPPAPPHGLPGGSSQSPTWCRGRLASAPALQTTCHAHTHTHAQPRTVHTCPRRAEASLPMRRTHGTPAPRAAPHCAPSRVRPPSACAGRKPPRTHTHTRAEQGRAGRGRPRPRRRQHLSTAGHFPAPRRYAPL